MGMKRAHKQSEKGIPPKEGRAYKVEIVAKGKKGDGIAYIRGFPVIIPGSKIGECLRVRITKTYAKYSFARDTEKDQIPSFKPLSSTADVTYVSNLKTGELRPKNIWAGKGKYSYFKGNGARIGRCLECDGYLVKDAKHSEAVCEKCGIVERRR